MNTPDISHPHKNHEELFNKVFSLAENNLLELQAMTLKASISLMGYIVSRGNGGQKKPDKREQERMQEQIQELTDLSKLDGVIKIDKGIIEIDDSTFANLINAIDERVINQIKDLDDYNKRCVLLVGGDDALIKGIVSSIYYVHTQKIFHYINCQGEDETGIMQKIFLGADADNGQTKEPVIERYKRGDTLFLRRPGKDVLYKLGKIIWHTDVLGMLILSAEKKEDVPDYFRDRITVIDLDQEKQAKATESVAPTVQNTASIPQTLAGSTVNNTQLCFTHNKKSQTLIFGDNKPMELSISRETLIMMLKKPKNLRLILKKMFDVKVENHMKIHKCHCKNYYPFVSKFNKDWRKHFKLNNERKLIKCENETVSIMCNIIWK